MKRPTRELVTMALQNPLARFVRELIVEGPALDDAGVIPIGPMSQTLPLLRTLEVEAPRVDWTQVSLPALERLRIHADVEPVQLRTILEWVSTHPKLRTMSGRSRFVASKDPDPATDPVFGEWFETASRWGPALTSFWWNGRGENR